MGIGKFILTSLVSAVAMLALAVVWYFGLAASFYAEHMAVVREIRLYDVIALAYLVLGAMMALMYPAGYAGGHPAGVRRSSSRASHYASDAPISPIS